MAPRGLRVALLAGFLSLASCPPARADWTIAAFLGAGSTRPSSVRIDQPAFHTALTLDPIDYRGESFTSPVYYGYRVGWILPFAPRLAVEAEFIHLKVFADTSATVTVRGVERDQTVNRQQRLDQTVQLFSISHGANFALANLVFRQPLVKHPRGDRVTVSARAGLGPTVPHAESTIDGAFQEQYELGSLGWQLAAGIEVRLMKGLHAIGEYKLTRTNQQVGVPGGHARTLLRTNHLVFGAGYRF